ncbi:GNAT family N-acetyltransferase [Oryzobacter terrae]|uniref:GNAT family N-acetyltransferase n=1 Tax=Oryzobacter terrae TaxID=1620385 RepID=UPI00366E8602
MTAEHHHDDRWLPSHWVADLGDGLQLRELSEAHHDPFWQAVDAGRADLSQWMDWPRDLTRAESDAEVARLCRQASLGAQVPVVVEVHGQFAGQASLYGISRFLRVAEITYWLCPPFRGRAIATRTVAALVTHAFEEMAMARVHARAAVENHASRAVLERCGFTHEGTARSAFLVNGRRQDLALYGVLPGELRAPASSTR